MFPIGGSKPEQHIGVTWELKKYCLVPMHRDFDLIALGCVLGVGISKGLWVTLMCGQSCEPLALGPLYCKVWCCDICVAGEVVRNAEPMGPASHLLNLSLHFNKTPK